MVSLCGQDGLLQSVFRRMSAEKHVMLTKISPSVCTICVCLYKINTKPVDKDFMLHVVAFLSHLNG